MDSYRPGSRPRAPRDRNEYRDFDNPRSSRQDNDFVAADYSEFRIKGHASRRSPSPRRDRVRDDTRDYRDRDTRYDRSAPSGRRRHSPRRDRSREYDRPYRGDGDGDDDYYLSQWQSSEMQSDDPPPHYGENDVSTIDHSMQWVLVRNLKSSVDERIFAKGLDKLYRTDDNPTGPTPASLFRVLLIRDRETGSSMSYGFAEYHTLADAKKALARAKELGQSCTIASTQILIDLPDMYVFPPVMNAFNPVPHNFTFGMSSTGQKHMYRDQRYYASEFVVNPTHEDTDSRLGHANPAIDGNKAEAKQRIKTKSSAEDGSLAKAQKSKPSTGLTDMFAKWQNQHANIREDPVEEGSRKKRSAQPDSNADTATVPPTRRGEQTFATDDGKKFNCYLCARVFPASATLLAHVGRSELHASKLKDENAVNAGYALMKTKNISPDNTIDHPAAAEEEDAAPIGKTRTTSATSQYVDRAALRRQEEAQTSTRQQQQSLPQPKISLSLKGLNKQSRESNDVNEDAGVPKNSGIGARMLQRAGWTEGQGLGAEGSTGSATSIAVDMYAAGVGLGHAGGKLGDAVEEAERATKGDRGGFIEKTKDVARERYESMK